MEVEEQLQVQSILETFPINLKLVEVETQLQDQLSGDISLVGRGSRQLVFGADPSCRFRLGDRKPQDGYD